MRNETHWLFERLANEIYGINPVSKFYFCVNKRPASSFAQQAKTAKLIAVRKEGLTAKYVRGASLIREVPYQFSRNVA